MSPGRASAALLEEREIYELDFLPCLAGLEIAAARAAVVARFSFSLFQASTAFWCLVEEELEWGSRPLIGSLGWGLPDSLAMSTMNKAAQIINIS